MQENGFCQSALQVLGVCWRKSPCRPTNYVNCITKQHWRYLKDLNITGKRNEETKDTQLFVTVKCYVRFKNIRTRKICAICGAFWYSLVTEIGFRNAFLTFKYPCASCRVRLDHIAKFNASSHTASAPVSLREISVSNRTVIPFCTRQTFLIGVLFCILKTWVELHSSQKHITSSTFSVDELSFEKYLFWQSKLQEVITNFWKPRTVIMKDFIKVSDVSKLTSHVQINQINNTIQNQPIFLRNLPLRQQIFCSRHTLSEFSLDAWFFLTVMH